MEPNVAVLFANRDCAVFRIEDLTSEEEAAGMIQRAKKNVDQTEPDFKIQEVNIKTEIVTDDLPPYDDDQDKYEEEDTLVNENFIEEEEGEAYVLEPICTVDIQPEEDLPSVPVNNIDFKESRIKEESVSQQVAMEYLIKHEEFDFIPELSPEPVDNDSDYHPHKKENEPKKPAASTAKGKGSKKYKKRKINEDRTFTCHDCNKVFYHLENLRRHVVIHLGEKKYACTICDKRFLRRQEMRSHAYIHCTEKKYKCPECNRAFIRPGDLRTHSFIHSGIKKFECDVCGKKFSRSGHLKTHQIMHSGIKEYSCSECGKLFARSGDLRAHSLMHSKIRRYLCVECQATFVRQGDLRKHMVIHSNVKRFCCVQCLKSFARPSDLKIHMLTHTGLKKFECIECGKKFARSGHLKSHMLTHSGVKNYKCDVCQRCFARPGDLKSHMLLHIGRRNYPCPVCSKTFLRPGDLRTHKISHSKFQLVNLGQDKTFLLDQQTMGDDVDEPLPMEDHNIDEDLSDSEYMTIEEKVIPFLSVDMREDGDEICVPEVSDIQNENDSMNVAKLNPGVNEIKRECGKDVENNEEHQGVNGSSNECDDGESVENECVKDVDENRCIEEQDEVNGGCIEEQEKMVELENMEGTGKDLNCISGSIVAKET